MNTRRKQLFALAVLGLLVVVACQVREAGNSSEPEDRTPRFSVETIALSDKKNDYAVSVAWNPRTSVRIRKEHFRPKNDLKGEAISEWTFVKDFDFDQTRNDFLDREVKINERYRYRVVWGINEHSVLSTEVPEDDELLTREGIAKLKHLKHHKAGRFFFPEYPNAAILGGDFSIHVDELIFPAKKNGVDLHGASPKNVPVPLEMSFHAEKHTLLDLSAQRAAGTLVLHLPDNDAYSERVKVRINIRDASQFKLILDQPPGLTVWPSIVVTLGNEASVYQGGELKSLAPLAGFYKNKTKASNFALVTSAGQLWSFTRDENNQFQLSEARQLSDLPFVPLPDEWDKTDSVPVAFAKVKALSDLVEEKGSPYLTSGIAVRLVIAGSPVSFDEGQIRFLKSVLNHKEEMKKALRDANIREIVISNTTKEGSHFQIIPEDDVLTLQILPGLSASGDSGYESCLTFLKNHKK